MTTLQKNIIANFIGKGIVGIASLAFIPVYIKFLGIESYGLVGFYTTIQTIFTLFDFGISTVLNREMARMTAGQLSIQKALNLVRTLEVVYWGISGLIAIVLALISPYLIQYWINTQSLSHVVLQKSLYLMSGILVFQFPFLLYSGGLMGIQKQVLLSSITGFFTLFRSIGAVLVLWLVEPTLSVYFGWQILSSFLQVVVAASFLKRRLPSFEGKAYFDWPLLREQFHFMMGMAGIGILSVLLMQTDKIILSKLLTLKEFGFYSLATTISAGLSILITPVFNAVFPQFSKLVAASAQDQLTQLYHKTCQLMSLLVFSCAMPLIFFSYLILKIWTQDLEVTFHVYLLVSLLTIGTLLHAIMHLPYALQIAYGWTRLPFYQNLIALVVIIPFLVWAIWRYGTTGAATTWVVLNIGYVGLGIHVMHTKILKNEKWSWYLQDVLKPFLGACIPSFLVYSFIDPNDFSTFKGVLFLGLSFVLIFFGCLAATPLARNHLINFVLQKMRPT